MTRAWRDGTQGDGFKLKEGRFRLGIRRKFFTVRVVRPWHQLPIAVSPSLEGFKARLDGALSTLGWWKGSLPMAEGLIRIIFKVPSSPDWSVVLRMGIGDLQRASECWDTAWKPLTWI